MENRYDIDVQLTVARDNIIKASEALLKNITEAMGFYDVKVEVSDYILFIIGGSIKVKMSDDGILAIVAGAEKIFGNITISRWLELHINKEESYMKFLESCKTVLQAVNYCRELYKFNE